MQYEVEKVKLEIHNCPKCGIVYAITKEYASWKRDNHDNFYCPNGHSMWYPGKTDQQKIAELNRCVKNCNKDKDELFDEMDHFRERVKKLRTENKGLKIVKSRYRNQLKKQSQ